MKNSFKFLCLVIFWLSSITILSAQQTRQTILFNDNWKFYKGDISNADQPSFNDANWRILDLPHDWSIEGPFDEQWASEWLKITKGRNRNSALF